MSTSSEYAWPKVGNTRTRETFWSRGEVRAASTEPDPIEGAETDQEAGYAEGLAAGRADGRAELEQTIKTFQSALQELETVRSEMTQAVLSDAAEVVRDIFASLFRVELQTNAGVLERLQEVACEQIGNVSQKSMIGLAQEDFQRLDQSLLEGFADQLHVAPISPGSVRIAMGSLVKEIDLTANLEQIIAAGLTEAELD